jgi:hypothetical protein
MFITLFFVCQAKAQVERDTTLNRCPVFITDTVSTNNFFIEARPAILKVYRVKGKLTVAVDQKGQLLSFYFHDRRLKTGKYDISPGSRGGREVEALYSFKSGEQVSYISLNSGTIDVTYDKTTKFWFLKVNGMIANLVERSVTYYKVKADLYIK